MAATAAVQHVERRAQEQRVVDLVGKHMPIAVRHRHPNRVGTDRLHRAAVRPHLKVVSLLARDVQRKQEDRRDWSGRAECSNVVGERNCDGAAKEEQIRRILLPRNGLQRRHVVQARLMRAGLTNHSDRDRVRGGGLQARTRRTAKRGRQLSRWELL